MTHGLSNFTMGKILGKGFAQAQVHTVTSAINCMHESSLDKEVTGKYIVIFWVNWQNIELV